MTWQTFYFICFVTGLMLSAVSLLGGMGHIGGHIHLPHLGHPVHIPHAPATGHLPQGGGGLHTGRGAAASTATIPWWNGFSIMIFLCWFGAAGYLLMHYGAFAVGVVLVLAAVCGFAGGAIIFLFLARVLLPHERELTADETDIVGAVGRISAPIRVGGTGEIVYQQLGALRSAAARSEDGELIQKQEEVFVVRYEKGIAYVRRWEDLTEGRES